MFLGFLHVRPLGDLECWCGQDGKSPWARFTSNTSTLMRWAMADSDFTVDAETGAPINIACKSGAYFQKIPNPKPGGEQQATAPCWLMSADAYRELLPVHRADAHDQLRLGGSDAARHLR